MKLKGTDGLSGVCLFRTLKLMDSLAIRGGVPVFNLPTTNPSFSRVWANPMEGSSPKRPAGCTSSPITVTPLRNVPVVRITLSAHTVLPSAKAAEKVKICSVTIDQMGM